jgi:hypothetical protein
MHFRISLLIALIPIRRFAASDKLNLLASGNR